MAVWSNVRRWTLYKTHLVAVQEVKLNDTRTQGLEEIYSSRSS